ncbi:MAG: response regulator [Pseudomonadota bacterium]
MPKIMLLEDEPLIAMTTQQMLEDMGFADFDVFYRLDPAEDAAEATSYDVAILDVNVDRERTSLSLARRMKGKGTAILFASGNSMDGSELAEIARATIEKPYGEADIRSALGKLP